MHVRPPLVSLLANLGTRRAVVVPSRSPIGAQLRFGANPGARLTSIMRSRRRLLTASLAPASKRSGRCRNRPHPGTRVLSAPRLLRLSRLLRPRYAFATNALVCAGQRRRLLSPRSGRVHRRRETTPSSPEQPRWKGLGPAISPPLSDKEPLARFCVVDADSQARPARVPHARRRRPASLAVVRSALAE